VIEQIHNRKSIRLKEYDYSQGGWYYITICAKDKKCAFGKVVNGKMILNEIGKIVEGEWFKTKQIRPNVDLDYYIIMPNHIHGIIIINEKSNYRRGELQFAPTNKKFKSPSQTIGAIIRGFKSSATKRINIQCKTPNQPVWQRNYYEHIIRNDRDLYNIRQYINNNPLKWELDDNYPEN